MLISNAEVTGKLSDIRLRDGVITALANALEGDDGEYVYDANGCALLPGLHDHHIHLNASAAALNSVRCGPPYVEDQTALIAALSAADGDEWIRGIGYHASVAGEIDRGWLDVHGADRPIRIQHRGGRMWIFNSKAMKLLDIDIPDDGRLIDGDAVLRSALGGRRPDLKPLIQKLLSLGITGVTEVTPGNDRADLAHYLHAAQPLNLCVMGGTDLSGLKSQQADHIGPLKIHNHDHDLPSLDHLTRVIADAHAHNRAVAIHCVTRAELMLSLAAIEEAQPHPGDRIEHAAIADDVAISWMNKLGLTVVTQPHFVTEREAAYIRDIEPDDLDHLWPLKSLKDAGLKLAAGSDAPFGDLSPWAAMASAAKRPRQLGAGEAVSPDAALALYTKPWNNAGGKPRQITIGAPADLCLIDRTWLEAGKDLKSVNVKATWVGGELVYETNSSTKPHSSAV